jgi:hypothetical protein
MAAAIAQSAAQQLPAAEASQSVPLVPLKLKLRGTFVGGLRKSAIIDDRLCFEGDYLSGSAAAACQLTHVEKDYVVLRAADQDFRLEYSP